MIYLLQRSFQPNFVNKFIHSTLELDHLEQTWMKKIIEEIQVPINELL